MIAPLRELELMRWYWTYALPRIEGSSTEGAIQDRLSLYSRHESQAYARDHGYSIYPESEVTAKITAETRNTADRVPAEGVAQSGNFRFVSGVVAIVGARDRLAMHVLEEYSRYGDAWGPLGQPSRLGVLYWMTTVGEEILKGFEAERVKKGWPDYGEHPRIRMVVRTRVAVERRKTALSKAAEPLWQRAWEAWEAAVSEFRERRSA